MAPKFIEVKRDDQLSNLPIAWAEFGASKHNRDLFRSLEILTLPTVHFYDGGAKGGLVENFPCAPAGIPILKKKLAQFLNARIDPDTMELKDAAAARGEKEEEEEGDGLGIGGTKQSAPRVERNVTIDDVLVTERHVKYLRTGVPFFKDLTDEEFDGMLSKARLQSFNPGDIIMRQGMPGHTFYVIKSGTVEMSVRSRFEDPIRTPPNYYGAVVNELVTHDWFGERALTTGEPFAATFRVLEKTRCFAFHVEDIPASSILSKTRRASREIVEELSQRYVLPENYEPSYPPTPKDEGILELLVRFRQIRQAAKCFEYVMSTETKWGDGGGIARRSMLASKLSKSQRDDFVEVFNMADVDGNGKVSLLEMRKFMESARARKTDEELLEMIRKSNPVYHVDTGYEITLDEFLGVMAEAEFYTLFTETFQALDEDNTGYVRAGALDEILGGVRDLISDDHKSIIDTEDKYIQVDYEQFSKMLLGAAL
mmetsp:Transcript_39669/g.119168  ORF Transcript_39669/g.119168 Transcript_39669/m.119168 type:complete len:483 (-) Transcript_39669:62-1510(-)